MPWIHPLFCFAAHTGARRSEILRALVADVDFIGNETDYSADGNPGVSVTQEGAVWLLSLEDNVSVCLFPVYFIWK